MATSVEDVKGGSKRLRGDLMDELVDGSDRFSASSGHLLKFHGIYQQDDRDTRRARKLAGKDPSYSCMVRCSVPGGVLNAEQWLAIDSLADLTDGTLRLTTRQGVQYHFVHKGELADLVGALNRSLVTTYAACGDVVRNIMVTPAPDLGRELDQLHQLADRLASHFQPSSSAYWELWVDGEKAVSAVPDPIDLTAESVGAEDEPIYGEAYLPRKFKMGIAWPGDNSIDVYSQDLGIVPVHGPEGPGAVILAGGGLGRSHKDETTFARLADPLAWVPDSDIVEVAEAVVTTFRDHGNRADRSHARLKYLVAERGVDWLREEVELRIGRQLHTPVPLPAWARPRTSLGWHRQQPVEGRAGDLWYLGIAVPSGRLGDTDGIRRRLAVSTVVERFGAEVRLTPHQDLLLCGIADADRDAVDTILTEHGVPRAAELSLSVVSSMACPALPTCGQALGEAERVLPEVTDLLDRLLTERNLDDVRIETRMTGCPNGCARPYVAELGIVGRTKTTYDIFVGGDPAGTRLSRKLIESVPLQKLGDVLQPLFDRFAASRLTDESFGDWTLRVGVESLAADLPVFGRGRTDGSTDPETANPVSAGSVSADRVSP